MCTEEAVTELSRSQNVRVTVAASDRCSGVRNKRARNSDPTAVQISRTASASCMRALDCDTRKRPEKTREKKDGSGTQSDR